MESARSKEDEMNDRERVAAAAAVVVVRVPVHAYTSADS